MKLRNKLPVIAMLWIALIAGCAKDKFAETVGLCPTVVSTIPADKAVGVLLNQVVSVTFNEKMDPATITNKSITLTGSVQIIGAKAAFVSIEGVVTYNDKTATFTPTDPLTPNITYTGSVKTSVKDLTGNALQTEYVWTFTTGVSPVVISNDPLNVATNVVLNKVITVTFSAPLDPLTISTPATNFTIKQGASVIAGTVSYSGTTASFTPTLPLSPNLIYTGTITSGVKSVGGIPLTNNYVWTFSTGISPSVITTDPINAATNVATNKIVTATFSVSMDYLTITAATFTLKQGISVIAGTVTYSGTTASFTPTLPLTPNLVYTATITTGAKNLAGMPLAADYVWTFTTGNSPTVTLTDPLNLATGVALNKVVNATFSLPMDPLTLNGTTFTVKQGVTSVLGVVSYNGTTASFIPTGNLLSGTTYTATITTGAKSVTGIPLANNFVWTFSTPAALGPLTVDLKSAGRFGILAYTTVTNNAGPSVINNMDVGISPGVRSSITGFPPATIVGGAIYAADDLIPAGTPAMLTQAKLDLTAAYLFAQGATSPAPATVSGDQGGRTLAPGIYKSTSTLLIQSGDLTLDAQGDVNAVWIFQIASDFTTVGGAGGNVILSGGAQAKNIFWQTGSSAVIGDYTIFYGNILALTSITMNSHAVATGRMLAQNGAVVMTSTNTINKP